MYKDTGSSKNMRPARNSENKVQLPVCCARGGAMARPEEGLVQARMTQLILPFTRGEWTSHAVPGEGTG